MAASVYYECNNCKHKFITSGPWEFRWDKDGKVEICGHPLGERAKLGVDGLKAYMYCNRCKEVMDVILLEFKKRVFTAQEVWSGDTELKDGYSYFNPNVKSKCPKCSRNSMFLLLKFGPEIECPKCKIGKMFVDWIDQY